jgi:2',3'-cyclic-nucleotide 2'-phosphodiesterase (5'-nucleotidase family)
MLRQLSQATLPFGMLYCHVVTEIQHVLDQVIFVRFKIGHRMIALWGGRKMATLETGRKVALDVTVRKFPFGNLYAIPGCFLIFVVASLWLFSSSATATTLRTATLLSINDVYRLTGPDRGAGGGGLARVRALRAKLEAVHPDLLLLHAGDFLSPSLLGKTYKGRQMVDLMNLLDGNPRAGSIDQRMFAVFGNHEFDDTHCTKKGPLAARIKESDFTYIASNIDFRKAKQTDIRCEGLRDVANPAASQKFVPYKVVKTGDLTLGIYGLTIRNDKYKVLMDPDPVSKSCEMVRKLRALRVDAVVALTHLNKTTDLSLLGLGPDGQPVMQPKCTDYPDAIVGGHDHTRMALPANGNPNIFPKIFKGDADAVSAYQIILTVDQQHKVSVRGINISLKESDDSDTIVQSRAESWFARHGERYCAAVCEKLTGGKLETCRKDIGGGRCLKEKIARLNSRLDAEEIKNRTRETGFGDWFTDRIREASKAQVALFNAGGIRLNYDIAAGRDVTRRHMAEMFPFPNRLVIANVPASQLWDAVAYGLSKPGQGAWLHFSGVAAQRAPDGRLEKLVLLTGDGEGKTITKGSKEIVTVASIAFVLANGDKHGFKLCSPRTEDCRNEIIEKFGPKWPEKVSNDPAELVQHFMKRDQGKTGLSFTVDGRICGHRQSDCLLKNISVAK